MAEITKIRAHHVKSLFGIPAIVKQYFGIESRFTKGMHKESFKKAGYVDGYSDIERDAIAQRVIDLFYERAMRLMASPYNLVQIVAAEPDFVCENCPLRDTRRDVTGRCAKMNKDKGYKLDLSHAKELGLNIGQTYSVGWLADIIRRRDMKALVYFHSNPE